MEADEKGTEAEAGDGVRVDERAAGASETGVMNPAFEAQEPVSVEAEETESQADAYSEVPTDAVRQARVGESVSSSQASTSTTAQNVLRMPRTREPIRPIEELDVDPEKVALGRALFHDPRLSKDSTTACVSCHDLANGGDDGLRVSVGIGGQAGTINAPTVFNVGLNFKQFWDGRADTLEEQIDGPVQSAIELGSLWPEIIAKLHAHESYPARFSALYPDGIRRKNVKNALAEFMKSLTTPNSRFDQWLRGDDDALTALEERGYTLFKLYGCVSCHQGANVGGNMFQVFGVLNNYFQKRGQRHRRRPRALQRYRRSVGPPRLQGSEPACCRTHRALSARRQRRDTARGGRRHVRIPVGAVSPRFRQGGDCRVHQDVAGRQQGALSLIVGSDTYQLVVSACPRRMQRFVPHILSNPMRRPGTRPSVELKRHNHVMHRIGRHAARRVRARLSERTRASSQ